MLKNRKFMQNSGLFFEHGKKVFFVRIFSGFNVIVVVFVCLVKLQKC